MSGPRTRLTPLHLGRHMAGMAGMEADVLGLLLVPAAGHCALHAGALGANRVQFNAGFCCGDGPVALSLWGWLCLFPLPGKTSSSD